MENVGDLNELDRAIDLLIAGEEPEGRPELAALIALAGEIRHALPLQMSPGAWDAHLTAIKGEASMPARRSLRSRIAVVGLAAAVAVSLLGSSAFAASSASAPGEPLFGIKRAFERIGLAMHLGRSSRTAFAFTIVQHRMAELRAAAGTSRAEQARAAYEEALAEADRLLGNQPAFDDALLSHVEDQLAKHVAVLTDLLDKAPDEAREGIQRAIDNASKAEEHAARGRSKNEPPAPPRGGGSSRSGRHRS